MSYLISAIKEAAMNTGCEVRTNYSGRGMYGRTCLAVTEDRSTIQDLIAETASLLHDHYKETDVDMFSADVATLITGVKYDSMGHDQIAYWPDLNVDDEDQG